MDSDSSVFKLQKNLNISDIENHSQQPQKEEKGKSSLDSPDDFEHLGSDDSSPLQENVKGDLKLEAVKDTVLGNFASTARDFATEINKEANKAAEDIFEPLKETITSNISGMDSNLMEMGDTIPDKHTEHKLDTFLSEFKSDSGFQRTEGLPIEGERKETRFDDIKATTQNFMDFEREKIIDKTEDLLSKMPDVPKDFGFDLPSEDVPKVPIGSKSPENERKVVEDMKESFKEKIDDFGGAFDSKPPLIPEPAPKIERHSNDSFFQNVSQFDPIATSTLPPEPSPLPKEKSPEKDEPKIKPSAPLLLEEKYPEREIRDRPYIEEMKPVKVEEKLIDEAKKIAEEPPSKPLEKAPKIPAQEPAKRPVDEGATKEKQPTETKAKLEKQVIEAEALFCNLGLVESLIYWRDPKKSGPVFASVLIVLLALTYFSLISVVAYLSLLILTGTISFRIYKNVVQAVQKTGDGHPFKEILESDVGLPQDKAKEISEVLVAHLNGVLSELRRLFLVEDLVDSIKFGVFLWCLTYLGAWFNGMTLVIIAWVALFTLPKVYEVNKTQIDNNLELVKSKLADITSKVKAAIPIGKKEEKKDQ